MTEETPRESTKVTGRAPTDFDSVPVGGMVLRLVLGAIVFGLIVAFCARGGNFVDRLPDEPHLVDGKLFDEHRRAMCGPALENGQLVVVDMLYSDDKVTWIKDATTRFTRKCPNAAIRATPISDIHAADGIAEGRHSPLAWSPADDLAARYLHQRQLDMGDKSVVDLNEPPSLVKSPLVYLSWEDRLHVALDILVRSKTKEGAWMESLCPLIPREVRGIEAMPLEDKVPGTWIDWYHTVHRASPTTLLPGQTKKKAEPVLPGYTRPLPSVAELRTWGRVKFAHTSPTQSSAGLGVLYLAMYDYVLPPTERRAEMAEQITNAYAHKSKVPLVVHGDIVAEDLKRAFPKRRDGLQRWLERCQAGLAPSPTSAKLLTDDLINVGPARYDGVATYEHYVFSIFAALDEHALDLPDLRVVYPLPTLMNEHPVYYFNRPGVTDAQKEVLARWIAFLRGHEMQHLAISYGFRPSNSEVTIRTEGPEENPFMSARRYGVNFELPIVEPPRVGGDVIKDIIKMWQDATGRN
jgi:Bacterial extracellular solute-binding protein